MTTTVTCTYDHGIIEAKDKAAIKIAKKHGGEFVGGGTFLDEQAQRDLQFDFTNDAQARQAAEELKAAKFENVHVYGFSEKMEDEVFNHLTLSPLTAPQIQELLDNVKKRVAAIPVVDIKPKPST